MSSAPLPDSSNLEHALVNQKQYLLTTENVSEIPLSLSRTLKWMKVQETLNSHLFPKSKCSCVKGFSTSQTLNIKCADHNVQMVQQGMHD